MTDSISMSNPQGLSERPHSIRWSYATKRAVFIKLAYAALILAMYCGLAQAYTNLWQPLFAYSDFVQSYIPQREIEALLVLSMAALLIPASYRRPSDVYMCIAVITALVPTAVMYVYGNTSATTAYLTFAGLAIVYASRNVPVPIPNLGWIGPFDATLPVTALAIGGALLAAYIMGFDDFSFALFDVYSRRHIASEKITDYAVYAVSLGLTASSLAIILSLHTRNMITLIINLIVASLYFGLIGNKAPFMTLPIIIALNSALRRNNIILYMLFITCAIIAVLAVLANDLSFWYTENGELSTTFSFASTFERRSLLLPVWVNDAYIKYFDTHDKLYWAYSRLSFGMVPQILPFDPPYTIGYFLDKNGMHANTGFVGTGYMNAGTFGVFLYAVLIGLCCRAIDFYASLRGTKVLSTLICLPGFTSAITSSEVPTELITHGWIVAILLVALSPPQKEPSS